MKKLVILIPVTLIALSAAAVVGLEYSKPEPLVVEQTQKSQNASEVFGQNEHLMRQILRYGDQQSLEKFHQSLNQLDGFLAPYTNKGLNTAKADALIEQYVQDSIKVTQAAPAFMNKLKTADAYERSNEAKFMASLEQIGLYELTKGFEELEKVRLAYIKEPTKVSAQTYMEQSDKVKTIIAELYLDSAIESPLFAYLDNHRHYYATVVAMYDAIGAEKIERLSATGYAIKTELQLLPKL